MRLILLGLAICVCLGCSSHFDDLVPVSGHLLWEDGTAISSVKGFVRFDPIDPKFEEYSPLMEKQSIVGELTGDGHFELTTYRTRNAKSLSQSGAPLGIYRVKVFMPPGLDGKPIIDPDYEHHVRSPLSATIGLEENDFEFTVDRTFKGRDARQQSAAN